jgi:hypothetical protein
MSVVWMAEREHLWLKQEVCKSNRVYPQTADEQCAVHSPSHKAVGQLCSWRSCRVCLVRSA